MGKKARPPPTSGVGREAGQRQAAAQQAGQANAHVNGGAGAAGLHLQGVEAGGNAMGKCRMAQRAVPGSGAGKREKSDATPDFCFWGRPGYALEDQSTARPAWSCF